MQDFSSYHCQSLQWNGCGSVASSACFFWFCRCAPAWPKGSWLSSFTDFCLSPLRTAFWHTRRPKVIMVKYQLHLLDGSRNLASMVTEMQWEASGFGNRAHPPRPTPSHCQTDALEMEEHTQMGLCLCHSDLHDICSLALILPGISFLKMGCGAGGVRDKL